jgi:hypothetical protein
MARTHASLAIFLSLAGGCSAPPSATGPLPVAMTPSQGTGVAPLQVLISGQRFEAAAKTDFEKGSASLDPIFRVRLVPEAGGDPVPLEEVRLTERRQLEARVPAGIPRGAYSLEVTAPTGRTGLLPQAFRVLTSAESVVSFRVEPAETAHAGVPFLLSLTAVDGTGLVVDGFASDVQLSDLTGTVAPATSGAFSLGRLSVRVTVASLAAADRITVIDPLGHTGASAPFAVVAGPAVALAFTSAPVTVAAGACSSSVTVELRDAVGIATQAGVAVDVQLQSSPAGSLAFFADASCTAPVAAVSISPGAASTTFRIRGAAAGPVEIRAAPSALPSATQSATIAP